MSRANQPQYVELDIVEFSKKGNGIGFVKHKSKECVPVEVSFAIPGDSVKATARFKRAKGTGTLTELVTPSKYRISPRCIHFGVCGGCRWQQLDYREQLNEKEKKVHTLFAPFLTERSQLRPIVACAEPWQFRNKMEFSFSSDLSQKKYLGLIMDSSRGKVLNLEECHLTHEWFVSVLKGVRQWWEESNLDAYHHYRNTGSLRTLTLREGQRTGDRMVILTVSGNPDYAIHKEELERFVSVVRACLEPLPAEGKLSIFLRIQQLSKGFATQFYEMLLYGAEVIREKLFIHRQKEEALETLEFKISPAAFFQPNTRQAERLYSLAIELISPFTIAYDLYCGTGTLSICLAKHAQQVVGVEISPEAVLDAKANASLNHCSNAHFVCGSVHEQLTNIIENNTFPLPDLVVVDPPRSGLDPHTIQQILKIKPKKILYISCNPATQAENMKDLIDGGYHLEILQPVDQFPHTVHIENIAILIKDED